MSVPPRRERMHTCHVSGNILTSDCVVVMCDFGNLYDKEEIVNFLLRRAQDDTIDKTTDESLPHIRSLKDLYPIMFNSPCPVTGTETSNGGSAAFVVVVEKKKKAAKKEEGADAADAADASDAADTPPPAGGEVVSDRAIKELGAAGVLTTFAGDYPARLVKLLPEFEELEAIKGEVAVRREGEKKGGKKKKKREGEEEGAGGGKKKSKVKRLSDVSSSVTSAAAKAVSQAVAANSNIAGLFHETDNSVGDANKLFSCSAGRRY